MLLPSPPMELFEAALAPVWCTVGSTFRLGTRRTDVALLSSSFHYVTERLEQQPPPPRPICGPLIWNG
ncbi:hypothetical protein EYF80_044946 [Liparis tanakae]|uniref:Uncharacterized protein n=1 Tax=Liparis tanakae TaxID=230148 RepID=A0A4Z2FUA9_9TELE|nr:hypothetical protein EYF80_044946 [Liparis tanakae]